MWMLVISTPRKGSFFKMNFPWAHCLEEQLERGYWEILSPSYNSRKYRLRNPIS
jgi:hypothetical protein